jgi:hypothetical protein
MNSDNHTIRDYSNLPIGNNNNNENFQNIPNPNTKLDNLYINNTNMTAPSPQNNTFEFYFPLPNDRIYHVTYTELNSTEIVRLLNNRIDLSHIPNHRLPYHYNVQHLIRQQFVQQSIDYQQNTISQQSFDTQTIFQKYSDNNAYDASSIPLVQQPVDNQQDTVPQQFFDNTKFEFYLPLPNDVYIYHVTCTELNLTEIARLLNNRIDSSDHRIPSVQQSVG